MRVHSGPAVGRPRNDRDIRRHRATGAGPSSDCPKGAAHRAMLRRCCVDETAEARIGATFRPRREERG
jgi:hypothetical protein